MSEIAAASSESPFDGLMGEDGRWSARDLQGLMAYTRFEDFKRIVERAKQSAANSGHNAEEAFAAITEHVTTSGNAPNVKRRDYRLTRHAAYLVAMNGDPNKAEVAAAQAYFATKTREAEVAVPRELTRKELALAVIAAEEEKERIALEAAQAKEALAIAAPKVERYDSLMNAEGLVGMRAVADMLDVDVKFMTNWLVSQGIFRKEVSAGQKNGRNMPRRRYQTSGHFEVRMETNGKVKYQVAYATSKGLDLILEKWSY